MTKCGQMKLKKEFTAAKPSAASEGIKPATVSDSESEDEPRRGGKRGGKSGGASSFNARSKDIKKGDRKDTHTDKKKQRKPLM